MTSVIKHLSDYQHVYESKKTEYKTWWRGSCIGNKSACTGVLNKVDTVHNIGLLKLKHLPLHPARGGRHCTLFPWLWSPFPLNDCPSLHNESLHLADTSYTKTPDTLWRLVWLSFVRCWMCEDQLGDLWRRCCVCACSACKRLPPTEVNEVIWPAQRRHILKTFETNRYRQAVLSII